MSEVRKAAIPVAGMGTRFLPVTKAVPKELLPVGTKPTLQIVIEEAAASGIEEVVLITSPDKQEITNFFRTDTAYDQKLKAAGKEALLDGLSDLLKKVKITTAPQENPKGLGHAILCAKEAVCDEPFIVILPDVLIESRTPCCKQLIDAYKKTGCAVNATEHTPKSQIHLYGIYDIERSENKFHYASAVIEKPSAEEAPSDLSVVGRYLFPAETFKILEETPPGKNNEIQLADAMNTLAKMGKMVAYEYEGRQFDTGDPAGFLQANIFYGYKNHKKEIEQFMEEVINHSQSAV
ncbi:MAG: UTP--glucose-1-phosphate uridylyltransferase [Deltaproteobacteria bacterium]|jgi:UTP--glucose-1-phosphate uridylyltransferase|nr:UTP--glucose-1-phosphate uridylyltransferase [Deltaproteobacteria bacterium]